MSYEITRPKFKEGDTIESLHSDMTAEANAAGGGVCPMCQSHVQVYKRKLNSAMAYALVLACNGSYEWLPLMDLVPESAHSYRDHAKLVWWGLLDVREDESDGRHHKLYRVTLKGRLFARNLITLPRYAVEYKGIVLEITGKQIGIVEALGNNFNYPELMEANRSPEDIEA